MVWAEYSFLAPSPPMFLGQGAIVILGKATLCCVRFSLYWKTFTLYWKTFNIPGLQAPKSHLAFGLFLSFPEADSERRHLCKGFLRKSTYENWTERGEVGQGRRDTKTVKFQAKFQPQTDPMSSSEHKLHLRVVLAWDRKLSFVCLFFVFLLLSVIGKICCVCVCARACVGDEGVWCKWVRY